MDPLQEQLQQQQPPPIALAEAVNQNKEEEEDKVTEEEDMVDKLNTSMNSVQVHENSGAHAVTGTLQVPCHSGRRTNFDERVNAVRGCVMMRMIVHPGATLDDVEIT